MSLKAAAGTGTRSERAAAGNGATFQNDLREFITAVEKRGELAHVKNAHWDRELGAVTEVLYRQKVEKSPMLLFDDIPDYPKGYRCAYGMFGSPYRLSLVLGMVLCYSCISLLMQTKDDFRFIIPYVEFSKEVKGQKPVVLDTSVVIDGRIADVVETGSTLRQAASRRFMTTGTSASRAGAVTNDRLPKAADLVFIYMDRTADLPRLERAREAIAPNGAVWVVWPKGRKAFREDDVRAFGASVGLVDVSQALAELRELSSQVEQAVELEVGEHGLQDERAQVVLGGEVIKADAELGALSEKVFEEGAQGGLRRRVPVGEVLQGRNVVGAGEHLHNRGQPVPARAPDLLIPGLDVLGQVAVDHEAHVRLVDAHAEGDRRDDDVDLVARERVLMVRADGAVAVDALVVLGH